MIKNICLNNKDNLPRNICKKLMRFNSTVNAFVVQPDGKLLIAGLFSVYNGIIGLNRLIRLNVDGTEDTAFTLNAVRTSLTAKFSATINAVVLQTDGKILVGGAFISYNGQANKNVLIRLNPDGTEDTTFSSNAVVSGTVSRFGTGQVSSIAIQSDGKILVGGAFINYNGVTGKNGLLRFNSDGTEDTTFSTNATLNGTTARFGIGPNLLSIKVQTDGKILIGGTFVNYNGQIGKSFFIRLNSDGTEDTAFSTNAIVNDTTSKFFSTVNSIAIQSDGKILASGNFQNYNTHTGKDRLIRLNSDGTEDTTFSTNVVVNGVTPRFNATVLSVAIDSNSKILVGGQYTNWSSVTNKNRLMRFNSDGTEDTAFTTNVLAKMNGNVQTIYVAPDASLYIGSVLGNFGYNSKINKSCAMKLNSDGTENSLLDGTSAFSSIVNALCKTSNGQLLIGGQFVDYAGQSGKSRLIKISPSGFEDEAFNSNIRNCINNNTVLSVVEQSDGKILVGGTFQLYNGQNGKNYLIRLNADGTEDTAFSANATVNGTTARFSSPVSTITIQTDGKILVGGSFANYRSIGKTFLIRLNNDGTEDTAFSTNAVVNGTTAKFNSTVNSIAVQPDGKILVGGNFLNYNAQAGKSRLIRFNSDGTEDTAFSTNAVVNGTTSRFAGGQVNCFSIQSDGKILMGGDFNGYNTTGKDRLIRLNSDGTEDTTFSTNAVVNGSAARFNNSVFIITIQRDDKILVGGTFFNYNGTANKNRLVRLNNDGTEDTAFNSNITTHGLNNLVFRTVVQPDDKIIIAGSFTGQNTYQYSYLNVLESNGKMYPFSH